MQMGGGFWRFLMGHKGVQVWRFLVYCVDCCCQCSVNGHVIQSSWQWRQYCSTSWFPRDNRKWQGVMTIDCNSCLCFASQFWRLLNNSGGSELNLSPPPQILFWFPSDNGKWRGVQLDVFLLLHLFGGSKPNVLPPTHIEGILGLILRPMVCS